VDARRRGSGHKRESGPESEWLGPRKGRGIKMKSAEARRRQKNLCSQGGGTPRRVERKSRAKEIGHFGETAGKLGKVGKNKGAFPGSSVVRGKCYTNLSTEKS